MRVGRYQLLRRIAVGGMAEIYIARETGLAGFERTAVVKRILPDLVHDDEFVQLFLDEARLAARLSHPNIVHIYELGHDGDSYYIAMEYVSGCDLGTLLDAMGGPLPVRDALHIVSDVLEGLQFAHALCDAEGEPLGVVHRDIAPKNVLLSLSGAVKIVDFGIAKARIKVSRTVPGRVMGTIGYMSPEQAAGRPVDRRSDIFATGAMLYRMVTGAEAFPGRAATTLGLGRPPSPRPPREVRPEVPEQVERIVLAAMAMDPDERYGTAAQMRRDVVTAGLKLDQPPDPELLAGLVRSFLPEDRRELSMELSGAGLPSSTRPSSRPTSAATPSPFTAAEDEPPSEIAVLVEPELFLDPGGELEGEEEDEADEAELRETMPLAQPLFLRRPGAGSHRNLRAMVLPETVEAAALALDEEAADEAVEIVDLPARDTVVDLSDTLEAGLEAEATAESQPRLPPFQEPDLAEETIDESTSVDLEIDLVEPDEERTTMPEPE